MKSAYIHFYDLLVCSCIARNGCQCVHKTYTVDSTNGRESPMINHPTKIEFILHNSLQVHTMVTLAWLWERPINCTFDDSHHQPFGGIERVGNCFPVSWNSAGRAGIEFLFRQDSIFQQTHVLFSILTDNLHRNHFAAQHAGTRCLQFTRIELVGQDQCNCVSSSVGFPSP